MWDHGWSDTWPAAPVSLGVVRKMGETQEEHGGTLITDNMVELGARQRSPELANQHQRGEARHCTIL